ncbi:unnamed protein product, partial [Sphacelaria rigidula]
MGALLEAIATGGAEFCVKPHETLVVERSVKDDNGGASLNTNAVDVDGGGDGEAKSSLSSTTTTAGTGEDRRQRGSASRGMGLGTDRSPDPDKRLDINRAAGDQARIDGDVGRSVAAPQGEENHVGKLNPFKYRTFSRVDSSIMSSIATDIKPTWPTRSSGGGAGRTTHYMPARDAPRHITGGSVSRARGKRSDGGDVKIVIGPEIEWGLDTPDGQERITMKSVVEPLRAAGENGISLAELRKALRGLGNAGNGVHEEDNVLLAGLGHALRVGEVVCVCSAENIRYMHKEVAKLWIVPASDSVSKAGINSEPITRPSSAPQNINDNLAPVNVGIEDSMDVEYVEAGDEGLVTDRHGGSAWKGKKRAAAAEPPGGARQATASQAESAQAEGMVC